jgi:hypothetical protein
MSNWGEVNHNPNTLRRLYKFQGPPILNDTACTCLQKYVRTTHTKMSKISYNGGLRCKLVRKYLPKDKISRSAAKSRNMPEKCPLYVQRVLYIVHAGLLSLSPQIVMLHQPIELLLIAIGGMYTSAESDCWGGNEGSARL